MESYKEKKKKERRAKFRKIRLSILYTILVFTIFLAIVKLCFPSILFHIGENAYKNKDYAKSANLFKSCFLLNPKDNNTIYYWASSLSKMPITYHTQKDLYRIAQMDNDSAGEFLATTVLQTFKVNFMNKVGENYIEKALFNDQVLHWYIGTMPLKYYIDYTTPVPNYYTKIIQKSFKEWEEKTLGIVRFKETKNQNEANIILFFKDVDNSVIKNGKVEYGVGEATPIIENGKLLQMKIQIITQNNLKQYFTPNEISTVATHEIGHALGIWGHSNDINDIMYYSTDQDFGFFGSRTKQISMHDINTLRLLYFFAPDITNQSLMEEEKDYYLFAPVIIEKLEDNGAYNIKMAIETTKKRPDDTNSWIELANAYSENKDYQESNDALNKALPIAYENEARLVIYYNMANNYTNMKQFKKALEYVEKAKMIKNDFQVRSLSAYIKYKEKDFSQAEKELILLLKENPSDIDNALTLADLYIDQKKYFSARDILKQLIKENSSAKEDERMQYYKIYMLF